MATVLKYLVQNFPQMPWKGVPCRWLIKSASDDAHTQNVNELLNIVFSNKDFVMIVHDFEL